MTFVVLGMFTVPVLFAWLEERKRKRPVNPTLSGRLGVRKLWLKKESWLV